MPAFQETAGVGQQVTQLLDSFMTMTMMNIITRYTISGIFLPLKATMICVVYLSLRSGIVN
jgi:TRAP-type C4-dicarboxylate transport system permease large subunit